MQAVDRAILQGSRVDLISRWRTLVLTDIVYKIIAFVLIAPLIGFVFRMLVAFSGREILADEEILYFALSPVGLLTIVVVGAISIGTLAFEQAALMTILFRGTDRTILQTFMSPDRNTRSRSNFMKKV